MPQTCKTCKRSDVDEINLLLTNKTMTFRNIVETFGVSQGALSRHSKQCITELFADVVEQKRKGLLADIDEVKTKIIAAEKKFTDNGNVQVQLIARRLDTIEKEAKLTGAFIKEGDNPLNIEKVLQAYHVWIERNPKATVLEKADAIATFAKGRNVDEKELRERIGIEVVSEAVH